MDKICASLNLVLITFLKLERDAQIGDALGDALGDATRDALGDAARDALGDAVGDALSNA